MKWLGWIVWLLPLQLLAQDSLTPPPIYFQTDLVVPVNTEALQQLYNWLQKHPNSVVEVKGLRSPEEEPGLAQRRATWVIRGLLKMGMDGNRLVLGVGSEQEMEKASEPLQERQKVLAVLLTDRKKAIPTGPK
ncbi:MAG: hypothetical protein ACFB10_06765 [Salibacteraceae bacterium]